MRADLEDQQLEDPHNIYGAAARILDTLKYYEIHANLSSL